LESTQFSAPNSASALEGHTGHETSGCCPFCLVALCVMQMVKASADPSSLLGSVGKYAWVGGFRTGTVATAGWSWVDGTNASNLNCGAVGCGPWGPSEPNSALGGTENKTHMFSSDLNDIFPAESPIHTASHVCEIEVCVPGQYLGPNFTTGCLQCPPGSYSVGGAVGGCTLCPPGTFGNSTGLSTVACSGQCAAGRYGSVSGLSSPLCEGLCVAGYACLPGSTNATAAVCGAGQYSLAGSGVCTNCSAGTYGSSTGLSTVGCSGLCAAGRFGSVSGLSSSSSCEGACTAGYACPAGSTNATAVMCGIGQYSLRGAGSCTPCPTSMPFASSGSESCYAACPDSTWNAWLDAAGVEGAHSCFKPIASALTWAAANATCVTLGGRSHLLTSRQVRVLVCY
jgi:hypothetical protein